MRKSNRISIDIKLNNLFYLDNQYNYFIIKYGIFLYIFLKRNQRFQKGLLI